LGPAQRGLLVEGQDASGKQGLRPLGAVEPSVERIPLAALRFLQDAPLDLGNGERGDVQLVVGLSPEPGHQSRRGLRPDDIADEVAVSVEAEHLESSEAALAQPGTVVADGTLLRVAHVEVLAISSNIAGNIDRINGWFPRLCFRLSLSRPPGA